MEVVIIGAGGMGSVHARNWAKFDDVKLSIYDHDRTKAERLASLHKASVPTDVNACFEATQVWDICTPTPRHLDDLLRGLAANKIVACEKPLVRSWDDVRRLKEAAKNSKGTVIPCHVVRNFSHYRKAHDLIKAGKIGLPAAITMHRGGRTPSGTQGWFLDHSMSGGVLLDLAIHEFDWLLWTFGPVLEVMARSTASQSGSGPDYALTTLKFESGAVATVESSWLNYQGFRTAFDISGSEGLIQHDSHLEASLTASDKSGVVFESGLSPEEDPYYRQTRAIYQFAKGESEPAISLGEGIAAVTVSLAALDSAKENTTLRLSSDPR